MDYKVLYRKYRPKDFNDFIGQEYIVKTLRNSIKNNKNAHAYIFSGPRGTGKTSMAKIFAKALNCLNSKDGMPCNSCESCLNSDYNPDIIEIDAASNNGVDEIREIINNIKLAPSYSKYKVYIIDEVHMLSTSAFNALLLTLEEPPSHVVFILATTDIQNVPITVLSRCQKFDFKKLTVKQLLEKLKKEVENEKIKIDKDALEEIALMSDGGLRDAESILDQMINENDKIITLDDVIATFGSVSINNIKKLLNSLEENDVLKLINIMKDLSSSGINYKLFIERLINELRLKAINIKTNKEDSRFDYHQIKELIIELNNSLSNLKMTVNPYLIIELILLDYISSKQTVNSKVEIEKQINNNDLEKEINVIDDPKEKANEIEESFEEKNELNNTDFEDLIKIRINNCFVEAKKECLKNNQAKWTDFIKEVKKKNKKILSLLVDTEIVTSSDSHIILATENNSNADLINDVIDEIQNLFKELFDLEINFIAISNERWLKEKKEYINNIKNKYEYKYIDETINCNIEKASEVEKLAKNIFGEKLEIK